MAKRLATIVAAVVLILGFSTAPVKASWNACPTNHFCMWEHTNYWGQTDFRQFPVDTCIFSSNWVSSVRNRRSDLVYLYTSSLCTGTPFALQPGQSFSPMPGQIGNDGLRSFKMLT